jgi:DNA-binding NarL/FixJ family response regulator
MSPPVSVLVVDDQAPFRMAAKAVLRRASDFELVGEASSGEEAVELADALLPDLVLMDINMGAINGVEATRRIVAAHPGIVVFLCSTYDASDLPADASTSGARAYVHKEHLSAAALETMWSARESGVFVAH